MNTKTKFALLAGAALAALVAEKKAGGLIGELTRGFGGFSELRDLLLSAIDPSPSTLPKLPCPSTNGQRMEKS